MIPIWLLPAMDDGNHEMHTVVQHDYKARQLVERKLGSWWKGSWAAGGKEARQLVERRL